jgi:hypothetical protein
MFVHYVTTFIYTALCLYLAFWLLTQDINNN